jgi:hypothetical protein
VRAPRTHRNWIARLRARTAYQAAIDGIQAVLG